LISGNTFIYGKVTGFIGAARAPNKRVIRLIIEWLLLYNNNAE